MEKKNIFKVVLLLALILISIFAYWYFLISGPTSSNIPSDSNQPSGFNPFNRPSGNTDNLPTPTNTDPTSTSTLVDIPAKIPALRLLSDTPVGGYGASTTASTTIIRWVDRGRGNIYEAKGNTLEIATLSNTVVPKIYDSGWNKNLTAFVASTFSDGTDSPGGIYAELIARVFPKVATTTATSSEISTASQPSLTPFELRGKNLPANIVGYAVSPKKDKLFMYINEDGTGVGYVSTFDGRNVTQLFTSPLTQVNVEWPSETIIAITTKGAANERGYMYFVDTKTGVWKKILGPLPGLSTRVSTDAKNVIASVTGSSQNVVTSIYNIAKGEGVDAIVRTLADKCVWGNFHKDIVYCGVPSQTIQGTYPDDWYKGTLSTVDQIWQINASNGSIQLVSSIVDTSDRVIDAFNLGLDEKDNFLIFMNKNDLSLWSLDLVSGN